MNWHFNESQTENSQTQCRNNNSSGLVLLHVWITLRPKNLICRIFLQKHQEVTAFCSHPEQPSLTTTTKFICCISPDRRGKIQGGPAGWSTGWMSLLWYVCGEFVLVVADDSTSPLLTVQPVWDSRRSVALHHCCSHASVFFTWIHVSDRSSRIQKNLGGGLRRDVTAPAFVFFIN